MASELDHVTQADREWWLEPLWKQKSHHYISPEEYLQLKVVAEQLDLEKACEWLQRRAPTDPRFNQILRETLVGLLRYEGATLSDFTR